MPNISRSKDNQTIKFDQLIECNMKSNFLEKSYTECGRETSSGPFSEKLKLSISLDQYLVWSFIQFVFIAWQVEGCQNLFKLSFLLSPCIKLFKKIKSSLELVILPYFSHNFWRKVFLWLYSVNLPNFNVWLPLLSEILRQYVYLQLSVNQIVTLWILKLKYLSNLSRFSNMTKK